MSLTTPIDFTNHSRFKVKKLLLTEKDRLSTVGTLKTSEDEPEIVWKVSCYFDYNTVAEYTILNQLNEMLDWCPHFTKSYGMEVLPVHPRIRDQPRGSLPFDMSDVKKETPKKGKKAKKVKKVKKNGVCGEPSPGKGKITVDDSEKPEESRSNNVKWCKNEFIFQEYVESDYGSARKYFTECNPGNGEIYSVMQQVSIALLFSQDYCKFTHYDLHSDNVLVRPTEFPHKLYICDNGKDSLYVKTFGVEPVIIDTGYSYSSAINGQPLDMCTHNIHLGYTTHTFDKHYDLRMWLLNVIEDYPNREKKMAEKLDGYFSKYKDIYRRHHMTPHGWFRSESDMDGINEHLRDIIERRAPNRSILCTKTSDTLLCIGHLITVPLEPNEIHEEETEEESEAHFKRLWAAISKNFWTCENKLGGVNIRMYFWKCVLEYARGSKEEFSQKCLDFLSEYSIKITPGSVDFDLIYDSLHEFADRYKTLLLEFYERISKVRAKEEGFTKTPFDIVKLMEYVYRTTEKIETGEIVRVHSMKHRKSFDLALTPDQLTEANSLNSKKRAKFLTKIVNRLLSHQ